jgi:hypothetical protein
MEIKFAEDRDAGWNTRWFFSSAVRRARKISNIFWLGFGSLVRQGQQIGWQGADDVIDDFIRMAPVARGAVLTAVPGGAVPRSVMAGSAARDLQRLL